jgi:hypothetical protein
VKAVGDQLIDDLEKHPEAAVPLFIAILFGWLREPSRPREYCLPLGFYKAH